jgi:hypothetical protein
MSNGSGDVFRKIAQDAINKKRAQIGDQAGNAISDLEVIDGAFESFVQHFGNGWDIYFSVGDSEAHEVHGEIKHKYDTVVPQPAKSVFGLPVTDESPAANGGRFNDFSNGHSIYWHPAIGPRVLFSTIRDSWRQQGGEGGPLGYPVKDLQRWPTTNTQTDPAILYSIFQSGDGIVNITNTGFGNALIAKIDRDPLSVLVRKQFDIRLKQVDDSLGLDAAVTIPVVSDWSADFVASSNRVITYHLSGFHSNPVVPDTTFVVEIGLRFRLQMPAVLGGPGSTDKASLLVEMVPGSLKVQTFGIGAGTLQTRLQDGITDAFKDPIVVTDTIQIADDSTGPVILDMTVTANADLHFLVNPVPKDVGNFRQLVAQRTIDAFVEQEGAG